MESNTRIIKMYCLCTTKSDEKIKGQFFQKKPVWRQSEDLKKTSVDHEQKG